MNTKENTVTEEQDRATVHTWIDRYVDDVDFDTELPIDIGGELSLSPIGWDRPDDDPFWTEQVDYFLLRLGERAPSRIGDAIRASLEVNFEARLGFNPWAAVTTAEQDAIVARIIGRACSTPTVDTSAIHSEDDITDAEQDMIFNFLDDTLSKEHAA